MRCIQNKSIGSQYSGYLTTHLRINPHILPGGGYIFGATWYANEQRSSLAVLLDAKTRSKLGSIGEMLFQV